MDALANLARSIGAFEARALGHVPHSTIQTVDPTALGAVTLLIAVGAAMYVLVGKRRV